MVCPSARTSFDSKNDHSEADPMPSSEDPEESLLRKV